MEKPRDEPLRVYGQKEAEPAVGSQAGLDSQREAEGAWNL